MACSAPPPPPLPSLPPRQPLATGYDPDDRFPIAPRPLCSDDAIAAFEATDPAAITTAAARGVNFTCGDVDTPTLASRAIFANDTARLERLLAAGADPDARWGGHGDRLPIQDAIECRMFGFSCNQAGIVRLLLAHGADPNARWCEFESRGGNDRIPGCTSAGGSTPLVMAAVVDNADVVYRLLDAGADPWLATGDGHIALDMARSVPVYQLIAAAMFPNPATRSADARRNLDERIWPNWYTDPRLQTRLTALFSGAWWVSPPPPPPPPTAAPIETSSGGAQESSRVVKTLREWLPGVHYTRTNDRPRAGLVRLLLDEGEDANRRLAGRSAWTPLSLALADHDHYSALALLDAGADPNARVCGLYLNPSLSDRSPLDDGCTIDRGVSPLMIAAAAAAVDTMRELVTRGADPHAVDWRGRTVADYVPIEARSAIMAALR